MEHLKGNQLQEKLKASELVILDFGSPGCAPCKKVPPIIEELIAEVNNPNLAAYYVDIVETPEIAQQYFVLGVPTVIVFKSGKEVERFNSVPKKEKLKKALGL